MKRARVIYNPTSGREWLKKYLPDILDRLEQAGYEASCHATKGKGDAVQAAHMALKRKQDLIVAAGGDGTIYEVVNGLSQHIHRPKLGIIPGGTSNDFAKALGIPKDVHEACEILTQDHVTEVDIGRVNQRYFINVAGGGSLTEVSYEAPSKLKTMLGQLAYYVKGMEKVALLKPTRVRIESKEMVIDEDIMLFLVANSGVVGGFDTLMPQASLKDGYFDVLVVRKTSIPEFIKIATQAIRGEHLKDPHLIYFQSAEFRVTSDSKVLLNLDGELGGELPCHFKVLHKHLPILTPKPVLEEE